jgi:outer membrane protein assembly factor BamB
MRRTAIVGIISAVATVHGFAAPSAFLSHSDPRAANGTRHSNRRPSIVALGEQTGRVAWTETRAGATFARIAFIVRSRVLAEEVPCGRTADAGTPNPAQFVALTAADGRLSWRKPVASTSIARGPIVYTVDYAGRFGAGQPVAALDRSRQLVGLDGKDGGTDWRTRTGDLLPVGGSSELVLLGPYGLGSNPQGPGRIVAVSRSSGVRRWSIRLDSGEVLMAPAAVDRGSVVLLTARLVSADRAEAGIPGGFVAGFVLRVLDPATGRERWRQEGRNPSVSSPLASASPVVYATDGLVGFDPASGRQLWRLPEARPLGGATAGGDVIAMTAGGKISAVRIRDGAIRWSIALDEVPQVVAGDDSTVVLASYGRVTALDAATGAVRWRAQGPAGDSSLALDGERVYVGGGCVSDE